MEKDEEIKGSGNSLDPNGRDVFFIAGSGIRTNKDKSELDNEPSTQEHLYAFDALMGKKFHWLRTTSPHQKFLPGLQGARWSVLNGFQPLADPMSQPEIAGAVNEIKAAYDKSVADGDPIEVNIIEFSYGSVVGAQAALVLESQGIEVNSITLAKSMISKKSKLYKDLIEAGINIEYSDNEVTEKKVCLYQMS